MPPPSVPNIRVPYYLRRRYFDHEVTESNFSGGMVRDTNNIPPGGLYSVIDWLIDKPGQIYKRGAWERHSASAGSTRELWVGTIHTPTRVVCIDSLNNLYDVTSENSPTSTLIGAAGLHPQENSPTFFGDKEKLIVTDSTTTIAPKVVRYDSGGNTIVIEAFATEVGMGASPPIATYSCVHNGMVVLARGVADYTANRISRVWFGLTAGDINDGLTTWQTGATGSWIDTTNEISGLASIGGVLLVFGPNRTERILGYEPFGHTSADMQLQPFLNVGCLDARSIAQASDEAVIFAGEEGVWITNGSSVDSLTYQSDGTGIQTYWRSLFPRHHAAGEHNNRQLVGGMLNRDYYILCMLDNNNALVVTLLCHIPTRRWVQVTNVAAMSMAYGRDEQNIGELYMASSTETYVNRLVPMLYPATRNRTDGSGSGPSPEFISRDIGVGNGPGMKSYGFGWLTYRMLNAAGTNLNISAYTGMDRWRETTATALTATDGTSSAFVDRQRFNIYRDSQSLYIHVQQVGASDSTEIDYIEIEERQYLQPADSLGV